MGSRFLGFWTFWSLPHEAGSSERSPQSSSRSHVQESGIQRPLAQEYWLGGHVRAERGKERHTVRKHPMHGAAQSCVAHTSNPYREHSQTADDNGMYLIPSRPGPHVGRIWAESESDPFQRLPTVCLVTISTFQADINMMPK